MSDEPYNVCDCGHRESWHDTPHSPTCTGQFGRCECDTYHFDHVWPPPARSRTEAEKAIAAVLAEHWAVRWTPAGWECRCGSTLGLYGTEEDRLRPHVASVLADLMADVWDESRSVEYGRAVLNEPTIPNPYRVVDTEGDR